jgi:hypothetical protein
MILQELQRE